MTGASDVALVKALGYSAAALARRHDAGEPIVEHVAAMLVLASALAEGRAAETPLTYDVDNAVGQLRTARASIDAALVFLGVTP